MLAKFRGENTACHRPKPTSCSVNELMSTEPYYTAMHTALVASYTITLMV